jgi:DNA-directed RNA polymerase specialized sigma24 family protein
MPGSDAELLNTIRSGDSAPFDLLRARHAAAARYLAAQLLSEPAAADATVELAFSRVLDAIRRGGGPTDAFRPYLLTAVRRAAAGSAPVPVDDQQLPDPGQLLAGTAATGPDGAPVLQAFLSLPERWRAALWHTDIELATPAEAAPLLGLTAAGVLDLARRARDGLARAHLQLRQSAGEPDPAALADPGSALREAVAPAVLGAAAAAYLAGLTEAGVAGAGGTRATRPARAGRTARPARSSRSGAAGAAARRSARSGSTAAPPAAVAAGWLRHTSGQQRAIAAGVAAVLAMFAIGGYVLSTGSGASTPAASTQTADTATSPASPAPTRSTSPAPRPSHPAAGPRTTPPGTPGKLPPTSATPIAAPPPPGPPAAGPPPPPTHRRPGRPQGPRRPHAQITTQVSVFGPWGRSSVAAVAFSIADAGPQATAQLSAYVSLPPDATLVTGGHWGGDRGGWNCSARPGGVSCAHAPISAAGRTGGLLTVQVTGSRACGQPVQVSVSGGASTASAQSAGTIQCSRWHRGWSGHAAARPGAAQQAAAQQTAARQPAAGSAGPGQHWNGQHWNGGAWGGRDWHGQGSGRREDDHGSRHWWRWSGR